MRNVVFILLMSVSATLYAHKVDSLKNVLKNSSGHKRTELLIKTSAEYSWQKDHSFENFDSGILYGTRAIELATKMDNDTMIIKALDVTGDAWASKERHDKAAVFYDLALARAKRIGDMHWQVFFARRLGASLRELNRYYEAIDCYRTGLKAANKMNDKNSEAFIYRVLAKCYGHIEDYVTALEMAQKSIHLCDSLSDYDDLVNNYTAMGVICFNQRKREEALAYFLIADSISKHHIVQEQWLLQNMENMATTYGSLGNYDKAIELHKECIKRYPNAKKNIKKTINAYNNIGDAYAGKREYTEANKYFQLAIHINDSLFNDPEYFYDTYAAIAKMHIKAGRPTDAIYYAQICEDMVAKQRPSLTGAISVAALLSDAYSAKGDYINAYKYNKQYAQLQDSMFTKKHRARLADAETKFRLSEKNRQLDNLARENELHKVKGQRMYIVLGLGGLVAVIGAGGYRRTLRKNAQLRKQKQIIDDQLSQLAIASELRSKFYANMSHELRTPVTLLSGMLELMQSEGDSKRPEKLDIAYRNSRKLQYMIEEILDLSRLEKSETKLNMRPTTVAPLLKRIVFTFDSFIQQKGLTLQYTDGDILGLNIQVDEDKFEKVINNLIFNAIKFNKEQGGIFVSTYRAGNALCIEVKDTGIGISEKDLPHIFERFYQGSSGKSAEGVGIGLSLVQEFTQLMGGTITVASTKGQGSVFTLSFPLTQPAVLQDIAEELPGDTPQLQQPIDGYSVLLVEDNTEMRYYLREVLGGKVNIAEAGNGVEALRWLESNTPDLIISDIMMPQMDGEEFVATLKRTDTLKKIPVIMLTALAATESQMALLGLGVDDYIVKPFNASELRARVYNLLNNFAARKEFAAQPAESADIPVANVEAEEFRLKVTDYVHARLKNYDVSVYDLANELAMSERQLYRTSRALTGYTPAQLIKEVKLLKAYELLQSGDIYKVEDVARRVGFEKASYFSLQFFERFGKRPSAFL